jgi:ABC-type uncharacterized transport system ATPase subunit
MPEAKSAPDQNPLAQLTLPPGRNYQRLEVARAPTWNPRVIIAHNLRRRLDLVVTADVRRTPLEFAADGSAALLRSRDPDELLAIAGGLFAIGRGKIRPADPQDRSRQKLGLPMAGRGSD